MISGGKLSGEGDFVDVSSVKLVVRWVAILQLVALVANECTLFGGYRHVSVGSGTKSVRIARIG